MKAILFGCMVSLWGLVLTAQEPPALLLVAPAGWEEVTAAIVAQKSAIGIHTEVLLLTTISVWPSAEDIRAAIRNKRQTFPFTHVWLLGDEWHIPPFLGLQQTIHDFGYSLADNNDYLPDWVVARLPLHDAADALTWVHRQQDYRKQSLRPAPDALVSASSLHFDDAQGQQVADSLESYGVSTTLLRQSAGTHDGDEILHALARGLQWLVYFGHGDAVGFNSLQPGVQVDDILSMSLPTPTIVTSAACNVADFTLSGGQSMGEAFIGRGGEAFVGCTGPCHYDYSDTIAKYVVFAYLQHPHYTLGEAYLAAQKQLIRSFPDNVQQLTELTLQQFVLLGDPTALPATGLLQPLTFNTSDTTWHWQWTPGEWIYIGVTDNSHRQGYLTDKGYFSLKPAAVQQTTQVTLLGRHLPLTTYTLTTLRQTPLLYPNPATAGEQIRWTGANNFRYTLTNMLGQQWHGYSVDGILPPPRGGSGLYLYQIVEEGTSTQYQGQIMILNP